jgi:hypothetical protein
VKYATKAEVRLRTIDAAMPNQEGKKNPPRRFVRRAMGDIGADVCALCNS